MHFDGEMLCRGDADYEAARRDAVWNGRLPDRFPNVIVRAGSGRDVVEAIDLARREGLKVGVRSGGHSWPAAFLQDDALLLDLSGLNELAIDAPGMRASCGPGVRGTELNRALRADGLFFPTGHCMSVGLGGFLLQGGFGWNSRLWLPACASVERIDLVTAAGEELHATEEENSDLLWAARGAGPGYFAVVTRFHLRLRPRPASFRLSSYVFTLDVLEELVEWLVEVQPQLARTMECMVFLRRDMAGIDGPAILLLAPVLETSDHDAVAALRIFEDCPVRNRAVASDSMSETEFEELMSKSEDFYPAGRRFVADSMWTNAGAADLLPGLRRIAETLPPSPSHCMLLLWGPCLGLPDMAFSLQADRYLGLYSVSVDPADDDVAARWPTDRMREMQHFSVGIQLADENLGRRGAPFLAEDNFRRLEALRSQHDPEGLFLSYMGAGAFD